MAIPNIHVDFNATGILELDGQRYGVKAMTIRHTPDSYPFFEGYLIPDVFAQSNAVARRIGRNPEIKKVIFNDPVTVVIWEDGTKTVVKCQPGDTYSKETGLALCIAKKYLGNKGNFNEVFKKWIPEETEPVEKVKEVDEVEDAVTGAINLLRSGDIRVGDKVRVVRFGQTYTTYHDWVELHVIDPADAAKWDQGSLVEDGDIGVVKYLASHERTWEGDIAYVEIDNKCYMIHVDGIEKVKEA